MNVRGQRVPKSAEKVLSHLVEARGGLLLGRTTDDGALSARTLARRIGSTPGDVREEAEELRERGLIERVGSDRFRALVDAEEWRAAAKEAHLPEYVRVPTVCPACGEVGKHTWVALDAPGERLDYQEAYCSTAHLAVHHPEAVRPRPRSADGLCMKTRCYAQVTTRTDSGEWCDDHWRAAWEREQAEAQSV